MRLRGAVLLPHGGAPPTNVHHVHERQTDMKIQIIQQSKEPVLDIAFVKSFLRIPTDKEDALLSDLIATATEWVENQIERSILQKTLKVMHYNHSFPLPQGPVLKVIEVKKKGKVLSLEKEEYELVDQGHATYLKTPFSWRNTKIEVTYEAGFARKPQDVPQALRHAILGTVKYLYKGGAINAKEIYDQTAPWLQAYREYRLV